MKKIAVMIITFITLQSQAQINKNPFPSLDSLRRFNERSTRAGASDPQSMMRNNIFNQGVVDMLDSAKNYWSGRNDIRVVGAKSLSELKAIRGITKADTQFVFRLTDYTNRIIKDYQLDVNDSTSKEDSVTTIATASGKRLKIYIEGYVLANWWPLDRTGNTDCSASMQKAIDYAINTSQNKNTSQSIPVIKRL